MSELECLFCSEMSSHSNVIIENDLFSARWDLIPLVPGHAEVLPKRHVQYFDELNAAERKSMLDFVKEVIEIIKRTDLLAPIIRKTA